MPAGLLLLERVDQFDRRVEAHALVVPRDGLDADGGLTMRLAGPSPADQHDILGLFGKGGRGEAGDLPAIDLGLGEVEPGRSRCIGKRATCIW